MPITVTEQAIHTLEFLREEEIAAPIGIVWETVLEEMTEGFIGANDTPMHFKLELWPGGRWFRDLGDNNGHWWGTVQSIKKHALIEISGPLFMSHPGISNVQYRLSEDNGITRLKFSHRAMTWIAYDPSIAPNLSGVEGGWGSMIDRIRTRSHTR